METLAYDPYDSRGSWIVSVGKVELSSTSPIVTTVPIWENFNGNTFCRRRRRSAIIADILLFKNNNMDQIAQLDVNFLVEVPSLGFEMMQMEDGRRDRRLSPILLRFNGNTLLKSQMEDGR